MVVPLRSGRLVTRRYAPVTLTADEAGPPMG
jgi:hypothetical protein